MLPERLSFLNEFDRFYQSLVLDLKEDKHEEAEFYSIIIAKCKIMNQTRRKKLEKEGFSQTEDPAITGVRRMI